MGALSRGRSSSTFGLNARKGTGGPHRSLEVRANLALNGLVAPTPKRHLE